MSQLLWFYKFNFDNIFYVFTRRFWMVQIITNHPSRPLCVITLSNSPALSSWRLTSLASAPARKTTSAGNEAEHMACQRAGPSASKAGGMKGWVKSLGGAACVITVAWRWCLEIKKQMIRSCQGEIGALTVYVSNTELIPTLPEPNSELCLLWYGLS